MMNQIKIAAAALLIVAMVVPGILSGNQKNYVPKRKFRVAYFNVAKGSKTFGKMKGEFIFRDMLRFMQKAANDLNMKLEAYPLKIDAGEMRDVLEQCRKTYKPDMLLFGGGQGISETILRWGEKHRIPSITFNTGFLPDEGTGKPREKYHYWIGEVVPDDEMAGYHLGLSLSRYATARWGGPVQMVAFTGTRSDRASRMRLMGLKRALKESPQVRLQQVFTTRYQTSIAREKFVLIKKSRYPKARIFWAGSDSIGRGVAEGTRRLGLIPGRDVVTCGVDWTEKGIRAVEKGDILATAGGHFFDGAWAMVLAYDYLSGIEFGSENTSYKTPMFLLNRQNLHYYRKVRSEKFLKTINFKNFSRVHNPSLQGYRFNAKQLLVD